MNVKFWKKTLHFLKSSDMAMETWYARGRGCHQIGRTGRPEGNVDLREGLKEERRELGKDQRNGDSWQKNSRGSWAGVCRLGTSQRPLWWRKRVESQSKWSHITVDLEWEDFDLSVQREITEKFEQV